MPTNTVSVCRPGKFGNPFKVTAERSQVEAVAAFRDWLDDDSGNAVWSEQRKKILASLPELIGNNLACYCALDLPCHADVLLARANRLKRNVDG